MGTFTKTFHLCKPCLSLFYMAANTTHSKIAISWNSLLRKLITLAETSEGIHFTCSKLACVTLCGGRRKKYKLWRPSCHEEFLGLGYVSDYAEDVSMWAILPVTNSVYGNVSVSSCKLEIRPSGIVEMQVVKEGDNPRLTLSLSYAHH